MIEIKVRFGCGSVCAHSLLWPSCVLAREENDSSLFLKFWSNLFPSPPRCWNSYSVVHSTCRLPFRIFPVIYWGRFAHQKHWFPVHPGLVALFKGKNIFSCIEELTFLDSYLHVILKVAYFLTSLVTVNLSEVCFNHSWAFISEVRKNTYLWRKSGAGCLYVCITGHLTLNKYFI